MKKRLLALTLVAAFVLAFAGCGAAPAPAPAPSAAPAAPAPEAPAAPASSVAPAPAPKDLKLTVYVGLTEDHGNAVCKAFEAKTGVKTSMIRMSGGEILAKIAAEKGNPQASVWYGGPADSFISAKIDGLLENYVSPSAAKIPDKFKDAEGAWTGIYTGYMGFICNKKLIEEKGATVPQSWDDLLKPEFKGQVVVASPLSSGTGYTLIATHVQRLGGEEKAMEYLLKLNGQIKQYPKSGIAGAQSASLGEAMVGIGFLHDGVKYFQEGYTDNVMVSPTDGSGYEIGATAIIKGAPDLEAAKMFTDFVLSPEGQEIGQTVGSLQFLTHPDAKSPEVLEQLKGANLIEYDFKWAGENKKRLTEEWAKKTGN
ncbi:MAG: ABC transporter substrate-binding protein [Angelakisella sp.]